MSLFLLYLRIFSTNIVTRRLIYFGMAIIFCFYWIIVPLQSIKCAPSPGKAWSFAILTSCVQDPVTTDLEIVQGVFNVCTDIYILVLAISVVLSLHLSLKKKLGIICIFMTGCLAIVAGGFALYYRVMAWKHQDTSWNVSLGFICIIIEIYVAIICSSAPAVASFFKNSGLFGRISNFLSRLLPRSRTSTRKREASSVNRLFPSHPVSPKSIQSSSVSSSRMPSEVNQFELSDSPELDTRRSWTDVYVGGRDEDPEKGGITKTIVVDQVLQECSPQRGGSLAGY
ncbi:hypothetical protein MMC12_005126 [Toensbergia leucococca]|nr:hypothetical protein [Toensbergia leucococca]